MSNIFTNLLDFFPGLGDIPNLTQDIQSWFSSLGGQLASGLEAGFIAGLKDLWNVIIGPLEIAVGVFLIITALVFAFKNDILQAGRMFGMMAR